jgi:hypothetical protein
MPRSRFELVGSRARKGEPALVAADEERFARIAEALAADVAELQERLDRERRLTGGSGQRALDRDLEVHRLTARLRTLRRFGTDLCLGRIVPAGDRESVYIGRLGLTDDSGERLLVDWRTPAAEPFFAATLAEPMGLLSRRRYRWRLGRVVDYWDEALVLDGSAGPLAVDEETALLASLGSSRSARMQDVLGTIQADQDAIIRAGSRGALVVDGGPGTGKTVVALHRAAYLQHADARVSRDRGGILFVGPHEPYLAYVADVLPGLGEDGVQTCTLRDLVPEGAGATAEADPAVAALKASPSLLPAVEAAVRYHERPPTEPLPVETPWGDALLGPAEWAEAFGAADPGTPHDDARDAVWEALLAIVTDELDDEVSPALVHRYLRGDEDLVRAFASAWPVLDPAGVVADLLSVPAYLRRCAPWLAEEDVQRLQRADPLAWTVADLPLLDAARARIGDPEAPGRRRRRAAALAAERDRMADVVDDLIAADDGEGLVTMLRGEDVRNSLDDEAALPAADPDLLAGPFLHLVVDEAQELTDAEWTMLLRRCPSRSVTAVGDRAQARRGFPESWRERLVRVGFGDPTVASLTINYRTPEEVMAAAAPVIRAVLPDANVPVSVRRSGIPVEEGSIDALDAVLDGWLADHDEGIACVIGDAEVRPRRRVRSLTPVTAKGLEFDLVVLVDPESFGPGVEGAVDRYVAMTRATQRLVILRS